MKHMAQWGKLTYAQKAALGSVGKLMRDLEMIREGSRIGVAVSGGVDSFLLLKLMTMRQRIVPFHFELMALHLNPGFDPENHAPLVDWLLENGVAGHAEPTDHGPRAFSEENRTSSACFYCARLRRKRLVTLCREYNLTHLAFAHTAEDLADTFFMNMFQTGKVYGLDAKADFFGGELTVIRPLLFLEKKTIKKAARDFDLPVWPNPCPASEKSRRSDMSEWLEEMWSKEKFYKRNVLNALKRWQLDSNKSLE
jgi:tRNA(Ile)-lysidine synthase TilS/MesJ